MVRQGDYGFVSRGCCVGGRGGGGLVWGLGGGGIGGWGWRCGGWVAVAVAFDGPLWVTIEVKGLVDSFEFCFLSSATSGDEVGASTEG
jgi:hypothetical protein